MEEQEDILNDMIAGGGDDDFSSQFLNDSGEGMEDWRISTEETAPVRDWREKMTAPVLEP